MKGRASTPKPLYAYDLIAMDVDGTLLDSQGFISRGAQEAISRAQKLGIQIALVTGRSLFNLQRIVTRLKLNGPFIGSGGALICNLGSNEVILHRTLPVEEVESLVHLCRKLDVALFLDHSDYMMCENETPEMAQEKEAHEYTWDCVPDLIQAVKTLPEKGLVLGANPKLVELEQHYKTKDHQVDLTFTSPTSLDILPKGVGKGIALKILADHLQISRNRIAVMGDYLNDLDMFKVAGTSIAMGNAPDEVKAVADYIAPANDEGGVAWALHKLLVTVKEKA